MNEYKQIGHPTEKIFLDDNEYKRALLSLVKYCHDILPIGPDKKFYLPERRHEGAAPGPWFIGGAVKPFTSILDSLSSTAKRETGLILPKERFVFIQQNRYWFNAEDNNNLAHDALCEIYELELTWEEIGKIKLDPNEYQNNTLTPYGLEDLKSLDDVLKRRVFVELWENRDKKTFI